jgi:uncharacterized protein (TIGR00251 family)
MIVDLEQRADRVLVPVRVKAGSKRAGIVGRHAGALKIHVHEAPEKGNANRAVIKILAEIFNTSASKVQLLAGASSPQKQFAVDGLDIEEAERLILAVLREVADG